MSDYDNTNTGALFRNDKKGNEKWPDYRGTVNVGGTEYWLSAWIKKSKKGETFMSLSVKPKDEQKEPQRAPAQPQGEEMNDDIPF